MIVLERFIRHILEVSFEASETLLVNSVLNTEKGSKTINLTCSQSGKTSASVHQFNKKIQPLPN